MKPNAAPLAAPLCNTIIFALVLTACGDAAPGDAVVRRDSAGVQIVENTPAAAEADSFWTVETQPELSLGLLEGDPDYLFGSIAGVARIDDGTIVVADGQSMRLRYYDADGLFLREVGGNGDGPGEFMSLADVWACGAGTVYAHDRVAKEVRVWSTNGEFLRDFPLLEPGSDDTRGPYRAECSADGEFVVAGWGNALDDENRQAPAFYTQTGGIWTLDISGDSTLYLGEFPVSERVTVLGRNGGVGGSGPHPFGRSTSFALDKDRILIGTAETVGVSVYNRDGKLVRIMRAATDDLEVAPDIMSRYTDAEIDAGAARILQQMTEHEVQGPDRLPGYTEIKLDPEGFIWLKRFQHPWETASRWAVFADDGTFRGHVALPDGFNLRQIDSESIIGVHRDELDVDRVRIHALRR